jgi:uncharacterized protein (TIGR02246 family)
MKLMLSIALAWLTILFASISHATPPPDARKSDREQITAFMAALDETWNKHDMHAHAALFHEDGIWIAWTGDVLKGPAAYEARLAPLHKTTFRNSVHKGRIEELTFIAPDVAVVRGFGTVVGNEPTPDKVERYRILVVMTKRDGVWKLSWGQKTRFLDSTPDPSPGT